VTNRALFSLRRAEDADATRGRAATWAVQRSQSPFGINVRAGGRNSDGDWKLAPGLGRSSPIELTRVVEVEMAHR
jgi:hypothetical protein